MIIRPATHRLTADLRNQIHPLRLVDTSVLVNTYHFRLVLLSLAY
jgi:hypothetical protein